MRKRYKYQIPAGSEITGKQIKEFIDQHIKEDVPRLKKLDSYFNDNPTRSREEPNEILVTNNYAKYITYINNGYMLGKPVSYEFDEGIKPDGVLNSFQAQSIDDLDAELTESLSIYGVAYERIFVDEETDVASVEYSPMNTFVIYDDTVKHNKLYAINYSEDVDSEGKVIQDSFAVTVIDDQRIRYGTLLKDSLTYDEEKEESHFFSGVPVIEYINNKKLTGDYESVISLIDEYDFSQSDRAIDREKLVDAILAFYGVTMTEEDRQALKNSRTISLPSDAKGEYITKDIDEAGAEVFRQSLANDIHKFSFTPDLSDKEFAGNSSGVALLYKLTGFFWNVGRKSRYFEAGLRERVVLYSKILKTLSKSEEIKGQQVDVTFSGTLPKNDLEISEMINNLVDIVDKKTLVGQLSFVNNPEATVKAAEEEAIPPTDDEFSDNEINDKNKTIKE